MEALFEQTPGGISSSHTVVEAVTAMWVYFIFQSLSNYSSF